MVVRLRMGMLAWWWGCCVWLGLGRGEGGGGGLGLLARVAMALVWYVFFALGCVM